MRIILSCILSFALVFSSTSIAYADETEDQREVLNAVSDVVLEYGADCFIGFDSSSSDLQEDEVNFDSPLELSSSIQPLAASSISLEYIISYLLFSVLNTVLDLGYSSFEQWLYDVLGIIEVDYSSYVYQLYQLFSSTGFYQQYFLYFYNYLSAISANTASASNYALLIYDYLTDWIFKALYDSSSYDVNIGGYHSWLELIYNELKNLDISGTSSSNVWDFLQSLVDTLGDVITSLVDIIFGGILELLSSIIGDFDDVEISTDLSNLSLMIADSFPFGAIYIIIDALAVLSVDPEAPYIEWELFGEKIEIDLLMFDDLATGCRYLLLVLYLINLFKSTKDWAFGGGD